jgi:RNA polymerase sigma factor (sigma-70 family)
MEVVRDLEAADLVLQAADGDERAWEALVDRFSDLVWSVARGFGLSPADAADVSQTTWLRLAEHLRTLREPDRVGAWLITTARREALRTLRRSRHHVLVDSCTDWCGSGPPMEVEDELLAGERDVELWRAFDGLSGPCKALLRMLLTDPPPSYADVSAGLDMPVGSIGPTRARCLDRLRGCVASDSETDTAVLDRQEADRRTPATLRWRAS